MKSPIDVKCSGHYNGTNPNQPFLSSAAFWWMTFAYFLIYTIIFLVVYVELWIILWFNHKKCSFQSIFLFSCLIWSGLRAVLFSFFFNETICSCKLHLMTQWILFCFPVCLQFFALSLFNIYFVEVTFKLKSNFAANPRKYKFSIRFISAIMLAIFISVSISCAVIVHLSKSNEKNQPMHAFNKTVRHAVFARVGINGLLFVICAISLACCLIKIARSHSANISLRSQGTTLCKSIAVGTAIIVLYVSRSLYNVVVTRSLSCQKWTWNDMDWYNVSDQAELVSLTKNSNTYAVFGIVLLVWEFLPTSLSLYFFKVSCRSRTVSADDSRDDHPTRVYFFDDPKVYNDVENNEGAYSPPEWEKPWWP